MHRKSRTKFPPAILTVCALLCAAVLCALSCASGTQSVFAQGAGDAVIPGTSAPQYTEYDDLDGKTVAMLTGAPFEELIRSKAPGVKEFQYFSSKADMQMALAGGRIDAFLVNNAVAALTTRLYPETALFPQVLGDTEFGFAFKKDSSERDAWQEAFDQIPEETREDMWERWTGTDDSLKVIPEQSWPGENGTVHVAACDTLPPMISR